MNKKIIITGVIIGKGGTGKFVEYLTQNCNVEVLSNEYTRVSLKKLLRHMKIVSLFIELFKRKHPKKYFMNKIKRIKNQDIVIMHPQSIGLENLIRLISIPNGNHFYYYVLDNSFFCIKSYNLREGKECIDCLGCKFHNAIDKKCATFPKSIPTDLFIEFQNKLYENKDKIHFLSQNDLQAKLLRRHFGEHIDLDVIGMIPSDYDMEKISSEKTKYKLFDYVFHGNEVDAKGFGYALEIARIQKDRTFLFPFIKPDTVQSVPENAFFIKMTWETGLLEFLQSCEVILCFSLWSAPIEGSILKSIKMGKKVAVYCSEYSFSNELNDDLVLKLYGTDLQKDSLLLNWFYSEKMHRKNDIFNSYVDVMRYNIKNCFGEILSDS